MVKTIVIDKHNKLYRKLIYIAKQFGITEEMINDTVSFRDETMRFEDRIEKLEELVVRQQEAINNLTISINRR